MESIASFHLLAVAPLFGALRCCAARVSYRPLHRPVGKTTRAFSTIFLFAFSAIRLFSACPGFSIAFTTQAQIDAFPTNYPGCATMLYGITISESVPGNITNLNGLSQLTSIGGQLVIQNNTALANLTGLGALTTVGGNLYVRNNSGLTSLLGLNALASVGATVQINNNSALTSLAGLNALGTITGAGGSGMEIKNNNVLASVAALGSLTSIGGRLDIQSCPLLTSLTGFNALTSTQFILIGSMNGLTSLSGLEAAASSGGVEISSNPALTSIAALAGVTGPVTTIRVTSNNALTNLTGLNGITATTDDLAISNNASLTNLTGLGGIASVGRDLLITGNSAMASLNGLGGLTTVTRFARINSNNALSSLSGLNSLATIGQLLEIQFNPALTSLSGLSALTSVGGPMRIYVNAALANLTGLSALTTVTGNLEITYNSAMTTLAGATALTTVAGALKIENNNALTNLNGLGAVATIGGNLSINSNAALSSTAGMGAVSSITGSLDISGNGSLTSIASLGPVTSVAGLSINSNTVLTSLSGLSALTTVNGSVQILGNNVLANLTGLNVGSITGGLEIYSNPSLSNLTGLGSLASVGGVLRFYSNSALTTLAGLASLASVGGLKLQLNPVLTNLTALNSLTSMGGGQLYIEGNSALSNLTGLGNIGHATMTGLYISDQPSLSVCELPNICAYLDIPTNPATIYGNATGCATRTQVEAACHPPKNWVGGTGNWATAANWSPAGAPTSGDNVLLNAGDDPTIGAGTTAVAKSVYLSAGADLTIAANGTLNINNATEDGMQLTGTGTTVTNQGTINLGNTASVFRYGLQVANGAQFYNQLGATLTINNVTSTAGNQGHGLYMTGASSQFSNAGMLKIGATASIYHDGIYLEAGTFTTLSTSLVEVNRSTAGNGMTSLISFTNNGTIHIGNLAAVYDRGIYISGPKTMTNAAGATCTIDNLPQNYPYGNGLYMEYGGALSNSGIFQIGNATAVRGLGVYCNPCTINNFASGQIEVNRITNGSALYFSYFVNDVSVVTNSGSLKLGNIAASSGSGIDATGSVSFSNTATGTIEINNFSNTGILFGEYSTFQNDGAIQLGNLGPISSFGLFGQSLGSFVNGSSGTLTINNVTTNAAIYKSSSPSVFSNLGNLQIGNSAAVNQGIEGASGTSVSNEGTVTFGNVTNGGVGSDFTLNNLSGGIIQTAASGKLKILGTLDNKSGAILTNNATGTITVNGTLTNSGSVKGTGTIANSAIWTNGTGSTLAPGQSPGTLTVTGSLNLGSATYPCEINGTTAGSFDVLAISGAATLTNASLQVVWEFTPAIGNTFTILTCGSRVGQFATVSIPAVTGLSFVVAYNATNVVITANAALPLELLRFAAVEKPGMGAQLDWQTASESSLENFDIEKSTDGRLFEKTGSVKAYNRPSEYRFLDDDFTQSAYYRLKINNLDGRAEFSTLAFLEKRVDGQIAIRSDFDGNISIETDTETLLTTVADAAGQVVKTTSDRGFSLSDLPPGIYFVRVETERGVLGKRVLRQ